jgi:hypothetical protein
MESFGGVLIVIFSRACNRRMEADYTAYGSAAILLGALCKM